MSSLLRSFNAYFSNQHGRLLLLWRQVLGFRRLIRPAAAGRGAVQEAGLGLSTGLRLAESWAEVALEKQALLQAQLEEQLQDKVFREKDLAQQQMQSDLDKTDLSARVTELGLAVEHLQKQNLEKDQVNKDLTEKIQALESLRLQEQAALQTEDGEGLQLSLRDLAQAACMTLRAAACVQQRPRAACGGSRASGPRLHRSVPRRAVAVRPAGAPPRPAQTPPRSLALILSTLHKRQLKVQ
ncbi:rootletin-like, partial [Hylobates moloch]|uniref:rootletin-like n=1 Tax=Hylobates moloch TaxID=81572 RepID=UPI002675B1BD